MAACCAAGAARKPRGRQLLPGGVTGTCPCSSGGACRCAPLPCVCEGCACKPAKVLTAALRRAADDAAVTRLAEQHWGRINATHVAAALHRLAELGKGLAEVEGAPLLLRALHRPGVLTSLDARTLVTCAWALANLVSRGATDAERAELAAAGDEHSKGAPGAVERLDGAVAQAAGSMGARDTSMAAWAFATLQSNARLPASEALLDALAAAAARTADSANAREVANTLWAAGTLRHPQLAGAEVLRAAERLVKSSQLAPRHLATCLWGAARAHANAPDAEDVAEPLGALVRATADAVCAEGFDKERCIACDVSNVLWSFAALRWHPGQPVVDALARAAEALAPSFSPAEASAALCALATLLPAQKPCCTARGGARALAGHLADCAAPCGLQEAANALWAMASMRMHSLPVVAALWQRVKELAGEDGRNAADFPPAALCQLYQARWALCEEGGEYIDECDAAAALLPLEAAWRGAIPVPSALQKEVVEGARALLGAECELEAQVELGGGGAAISYRADVLVRLPGADKLLLEVDGPSHFLRPSLVSPTGATALRDRLLDASTRESGYRRAALRFDAWDSTCGDVAAREALLRRALLPSPATEPPTVQRSASSLRAEAATFVPSVRRTQ